MGIISGLINRAYNQVPVFIDSYLIRLETQHLRFRWQSIDIDRLFEFAKNCRATVSPMSERTNLKKVGSFRQQTGINRLQKLAVSSSLTQPPRADTRTGFIHKLLKAIADQSRCDKIHCSISVHIGPTIQSQ